MASRRKGKGNEAERSEEENHSSILGSLGAEGFAGSVVADQRQWAGVLSHSRALSCKTDSGALFMLPQHRWPAHSGTQRTPSSIQS